LVEGGQRTFDAVVTDIWMPHVDGAELIRKIKKAQPGLPVVAITGGAPKRPMKMSLAHAEEVGADAALLKPVDRTELQSTLERLLASPMSASS
jgi:CheY-like chemotaxis protein